MVVKNDKDVTRLNLICRNGIFLLLAVSVISLIWLVAPAIAQTGNPEAYNLPWWTIDGGGGMDSAGGVYTLSGTIGQPDAGVPMKGGTYALQGGFWGMQGIGVVQEWKIFLPMIRD